ncbi:MAG: hypothetical protein RR202_01850 [Bacteroidales bacterium]
MEELDGKIKKEVINKEDLPTDKDHPGEQISEENKIIIGDAVEGEEPSPPAPPKPKPNYVLIIVVIIAVIIGVFWGLKGCNERGRQDSMSFVKPIALQEWLS